MALAWPVWLERGVRVMAAAPFPPFPLLGYGRQAGEDARLFCRRQDITGWGRKEETQEGSLSALPRIKQGRKHRYQGEAHIGGDSQGGLLLR